MIVVDASVAVKWTVVEELHSEALSLTRGDLSLLAPNLVVIETLNVLHRKLKKSEINPPQLEAAARELPGIFDLLVSESLLSVQIEKLAGELDHSVYDCAYLACALEFDALLVTADLHFARKLHSSKYRDRYIELKHGIEGVLRVRQRQSSIESQALRLWRIFDETMSHVQASVSTKTAILTSLNTRDLRPAYESPAYVRLRRFVSSLSASQKTHLLALAWYGRFYIDEPLESVTQRAEHHVAMQDTTLDDYILSTFATLAAGIEKLQAEPSNTSPNQS